MSALPLSPELLTVNPKDQAIFSATPTLPAPRYGILPECPIGTHRFVMASNGVFVQARTAVMTLCLKIADAVPGIPYGTMDEALYLTGGIISHELIREATARSARAAPDEWAGLIVLDESGRYQLIEPQVTAASPSRITWLRDQVPEDRLVIDMHSHGDGPAYFSATDNESDARGGIFLSLVLGRCRDEQPEYLLRAAVHGLLVSAPPIPWYQPLPNGTKG